MMSDDGTYVRVGYVESGSNINHVTVIGQYSCLNDNMKRINFRAGN